MDSLDSVLRSESDGAQAAAATSADGGAQRHHNSEVRTQRSGFSHRVALQKHPEAAFNKH